MNEQFETEYNLIRSVLEQEEILEIQNVGETESTLDIVLIVTPDEYIQSYVRPLRKIGYQLNSENSTIIKLSFDKGDQFKYRLSLTQAN